MQDVDLAAIKSTVTQLATARQVAARRSGDRRVDRRRVPTVTVVPPPIPPESVTLHRPFWILATGSDDSPTDILRDQHFEPGNSWAKVVVNRDTDDLAQYELYFYFLWQNDTGSDAVVDVSTDLRVMATAEALAEPGWVPNPLGIWSVGTEGHTEVSALADLVVLEWWHQPPTQPPEKSAQQQPVIDVTADAGWRVIPWNGPDDEWRSVDASYHLKYPGFVVPSGQPAVFQVGLRVALDVYNGKGMLDAGNGPNVVGCSGVRLGLRREPVRM